MLTIQLLHPQILSALARAGHSSKVLIADGNYPASHTLGPRGELVSLQLSPGLPTVVQVLEALLSAVPVEAAQTMDYAREGPYGLKKDPPVWAQYRAAIKRAGLKLALDPVERFAFYDAVASPQHVLTIQTADQQIYANLLLTIGVRRH